MSTVRTTCPYCGVGCGLLADANERAADAGENAAAPYARVGSGAARDARSACRIVGDRLHPANFGRVCSKGAALADTLGLDGRLLHPQIDGRRVSWDEALGAVADGFGRVVAEQGPDAVAFYVSGQLLTEDYYVANKLMKGFIGSANIDTNSRLCMASAVAGYKRAFGEDVVPCSYEDLEHAELVVIVGSNLAWCHPVLFQRLRQARSDNPRKRIVVIDPRRTATAAIADLFLPIRSGTDVALFNGLLSHLRREDVLDWEYLDEHVEGFGAALRAARESAASIPDVASVCGLDEADVARFFRLFASTPKVVTLFSQGVNQSTSGTDKVNSIVNVHLASGRIGKEGTGPFSLTGQPNAMGGREVGGLANQLAAHMDFDPKHVDRVRRFWNAPNVATRPGLKAVDLFDAMHAGRIKAVWIMSTNPVVSMPDADRVAEALARCELVVVSDCMRHTDTTAYADVLLPAASWGEKSGTVTNSERRISRQRAFLEPPGEARADWRIVTEVARRMGYGDAFGFQSPADVFREHARLSAFENDGTRAFDIAGLAELSDADYDALVPVQWPQPVSAPALPRRLFGSGRFFTPDGKARLVPTPPRPPRHSPSEEAPFVLNTGRIRDHWHTMTRTGQSSRLSGHCVEPFVQVHPDDAAHCGLRQGDLAELVNGRGRMIARVAITDDVQVGHPFAPMHWNAQYASRGRVGALIAAAVDQVSGQPELKHAPVRLRRYEPAWHGFVLSRSRIAVPEGCSYFALAKGEGYWRYEIAGEDAPASWSAWTRAAIGSGDEWLEFQDSGTCRYRGALIAEQRLEACVFIGPEASLPGRGWLASLFGEASLSDAARLNVLTGRAGRGAAEAGPLVCSCFSVGRDRLIEAIRTQSLATAADIGRALGAGTSCGSCLPELDALLAEAWGGAEAAAASGL